MSLTLDDLAEKCPDCDGTGERKQEPEKRGRQTFGPIPLANFSLSNCQRCQGTGRSRLTESGRAIRDLLKVLEKNTMIQ
jgi:DnaJ-class molecular chaperone